MKIKSVNLERVCGPTSKLPVNQLPEVAFAGKSNVGKSSLINTLTGRKSYAKTSSTPGKTQTINFYNVNEAFYLVDLPGYGFAHAPEEEKARWGEMIDRYLDTSRELKAVFMLVDIRHDPTDNDRLMYEWVKDRGYQPVIIATKADKIKRSQLKKQTAAVQKGLGMRGDASLIPFSAMTGQGKDEIWSLIEQNIR